jgi:hypothetical protein
LRYCIVGAFVLVIMVSLVPLGHATPSPGIPILSFESEGAYIPGQSTQVHFNVQNKGADAISALSLDVKAAPGWGLVSGSVYIGDLGAGAQKSFSVQLVVGPPSFSALEFTAKSTDHIALTFPVSILVAVKVTAQDIANVIGQSSNPLLNIATQWGTYTINQIGDILFPSTADGITDETGFQQILQGYFVKNYLNTHPDLSSQLSSLVNQLGRAVSDTSSVQSSVNAGYSFSVAGKTYTTTIYQFLTWQIPFSQWTLGLVQDRGVADLIAWAIQQFGGLNVSANDIMQLANFLLQGGAVSLGGYNGDMQALAQLLSALASTSVPELNSLTKALTTVGRVLNYVNSVIGSLSSLVSGVLGSIINWVKSLAQQLYQIFQQLVNWISSHIPIVADAINNAVTWLYNHLSPILSNVIDLFNSGSQAQSAAQSTQSGLSAMSADVQQSSGALDNLATRLSQIAGQAKEKFDGFCVQYQPSLGKIQSITTWLGRAATYASLIFSAGTTTPLVQEAFGGAIALENTVDIGCSMSLTGTADPVKLISLANGASLMLGDMFPHEESEFHAIGTILGDITAAIPIAKHLIDVMNPGFDVNQISNIVSSYESASIQGSSAYSQGTPNYIGAIDVLGSITNLPLIDSVNSVLDDLQPCSVAITKLTSYTQQGMIAPDLQTQIQVCQEKGQSSISAIASADYSALTIAAALPSLGSQLSDAIDIRYQQFQQARDLLNRLESSVNTLNGCGFLWVQPDPDQVRQASQALQQAQSRFNSGQYADLVNAANSNIDQITSASQACGSESAKAKLELGGVIAIGAVAAALSGFAYLRKARAQKRA